MKNIDVWHKPLSENSEPKTESLSEEELLKAGKFYRKKDRLNYLNSHLFLREVLSFYFPHIKPKAWRFKVNAYGKPSLAQHEDVKLHFNLSHSASHVYIVFSKAYECGIDVEEIKEMDLNPELLNLVMSEEEQTEFSHAKEKKSLFFKYWTLKEAYVKAMGKGVCIPLNSVSFKNLENSPDSFVLKNNFCASFLLEESYYLSLVILQAKTQAKINFYTEDNL